MHSLQPVPWGKTPYSCHVAYHFQGCHTKAEMSVFGAGRGGRSAADEDDGSNAAVIDQDDDDDHVKLLNPVKVY